VLSAITVLAATPIATWWIVGDLSESNGSDYTWRAPDVPSVAVTVGGLLAIAALGTCAFALWSARRDHRLPSTWRLALFPLAALGAFVGWGGRVFSAAVDGANIGAGFVLLAAPIVVVTALPASAVGLFGAMRSGRRRS
jgi:uncharacterized membrane protein (DUF4010 family)